MQLFAGHKLKNATNRHNRKQRIPRIE